MNRRGFLGGLLVSLAAPAIVRTPGLLMPIKTPGRFLTLIEWAALNPGPNDELIELLMQANEVMGKIPWRTSDIIFGRKIVGRTEDGKLHDPDNMVFVQA